MTRQEFEDALERYRPTMVNFAYARLRSWPEAEDAVGTVITQLTGRGHDGQPRYQRITVLDTRAQLLTLFLTYVVHEVGRCIRARTEQAHFQRYYAETVRMKHQGEWIDTMELTHLRVDVQKAMTTLPPLMQYLAWRHYVEGYSWEFLSEEVGYPDVVYGGGNRKIKNDVVAALTSLRPMLRAYAPKRRVYDDA